MMDATNRAAQVRLMMFDVDGVMTDGALYLSDSGDEIKAFNALDGHGMKMLAASGVRLAIITGRRSRLVEARARNLGVDLLFQGVEDKRATFESLANKLGIAASGCGYIGDDVIDLPVMRRCGFAASVPDAPEIVRSHAHYVTRARGGHGAVRELAEYLMRAQNTLDAALAPYLA